MSHILGSYILKVEAPGFVDKEITVEFGIEDTELDDFKNAAYAIIQTFVLKLESKGLLSSQKYGSRTRYCVK
ncbi:MAG TPA: hypothetical protein VFC84_12790 [Desulfosporosinus sp.]|nr:hypothetical protein [Desulfosporosinus sp.]